MRAAAFAPRPCGCRDQQRRGRHVAQRDVAGVPLDRREWRAPLAPAGRHRGSRRHAKSSSREDWLRRAAAWRNCAVSIDRAGRRAGRGECVAADILGDARGIDHGFEQRVRRQPVGAVRAGARHFAAGPQSARSSCGPARPRQCRPCGNARRARSGSVASPDRCRRRGSSHRRSEIFRRNARRAPAVASRNAPRPAAISANTPRATISRGASSASGCSASMKRSPLSLISVAPSPRSASVASGAGSRPTMIAVG